MKAHEALIILRVSRTSLMRFVRNGKVRAVKNPNGRLDYNAEDVRNMVGNIKLPLHKRKKKRKYMKLPKVVPANQDHLVSFIHKGIPNEADNEDVSIGTYKEVEDLQLRFPDHVFELQELFKETVPEFVQRHKDILKANLQKLKDSLKN